MQNRQPRFVPPQPKRSQNFNTQRAQVPPQNFKYQPRQKRTLGQLKTVFVERVSPQYVQQLHMDQSLMTLPMISAGNQLLQPVMQQLGLPVVGYVLEQDNPKALLVEVANGFVYQQYGTHYQLTDYNGNVILYVYTNPANPMGIGIAFLPSEYSLIPTSGLMVQTPYNPWIFNPFAITFGGSVPYYPPNLTFGYDPFWGFGGPSVIETYYTGFGPILIEQNLYRGPGWIDPYYVRNFGFDRDLYGNTYLESIGWNSYMTDYNGYWGPCMYTWSDNFRDSWNNPSFAWDVTPYWSASNGQWDSDWLSTGSPFADDWGQSGFTTGWDGNNWNNDQSGNNFGGQWDGNSDQFGSSNDQGNFGGGQDGWTDQGNSNDQFGNSDNDAFGNTGSNDQGGWGDQGNSGGQGGWGDQGNSGDQGSDFGGGSW